MRKRRFSEDQIMASLEGAEKGVALKDTCRELGISSATHYQWRSDCGGLEASERRRLKNVCETKLKLPARGAIWSSI